MIPPDLAPPHSLYLTTSCLPSNLSSRPSLFRPLLFPLPWRLFPQTFTALSPSHKSVLTEMLRIQKDLLWLPKIAPFPQPDKNCPFALFPFHHSPQHIYNDLVCLSMFTSLSVFPPSQRGKLHEVSGKLWTTGPPASRTMCDPTMNGWVQPSFWAVIQNKRHESSWQRTWVWEQD